MTYDRNKTELTQNITRNVVLWLDGKGFKPVEAEVPVAPGWVADAAGVGTPTQTEMIELKLLPRPPRSPRWFGVPEAEREAQQKVFGDAMQVWNAAKDAVPPILTVAVEVKVSLSDYSRDRKRKWAPQTWPTNLCYIAMPEHLVPEAKWPAGWGVILFSQEGTTIRRVVPPAVHPTTPERQRDVILALAVARDHATRYERLRELQKRVRLEQAERTIAHRFHHVIRVVQEIMKGRTPEEALRYHGIRTSLPPYVMDELRSLRPSVGVAAEET